MIALALIAAQLVNPGFEEGLRGWQTEGHRGMGVGVSDNRTYVVPQSARGEHYLSMGWRARNATSSDTQMRLWQEIDARGYRGQRVRVTALARAPEFAHGNGRMILTAGPAEASTGIPASEGWQLQSVELDVPRDAARLGIAFVVSGTPAELALDDVRLEVRQR